MDEFEASERPTPGSPGGIHIKFIGAETVHRHVQPVRKLWRRPEVISMRRRQPEIPFVFIGDWLNGSEFFRVIIVHPDRYQRLRARPNPPMNYTEFLESVRAYFDAADRIREEADRFATVGEDGMTGQAMELAGEIRDAFARWEKIRSAVEEDMEE